LAPSDEAAVGALSERDKKRMAMQRAAEARALAAAAEALR